MKKYLSVLAILFLSAFALVTHAVTAHSVTLLWTASVVPVGASPVSSYNIYRATVSGGEGVTPFGSVGNVVTYTDPSVVAGLTYFYEVTAVNSAGESAKSNEVSIQVPNVVPPNAPTGLTGTAQ